MKKKWIVVQYLLRKSAAALVEYAEEIVNMVSASPYFTAPNPAPANPTLAQITTDIAALDAAISAPGGGKTKTDNIRQAKEVVINDLDLLGLYVQMIANQPANKTIGDIIIHAAGMEYKKSSMPKPRVFAVVNDPAQQGSVIARTVKSDKQAAYEWQFKKANEVNYAIAQITVKASYTYTNLVSGTRYQFRVKTVDALGNSNMSQVLELVVL
ncbi:MAG: hypothetical protein AB7G44_09480 [Bacteroidia bacterium]